MTLFVARHAENITPSDTNNLSAVAGYISFTNTGGTQALVVTMAGGEVVSIVLPSGMYEIGIQKVWAATTVTNIVGYWA